MFLLGAPEALNTIYVVTDLKAVSKVKDSAGIHITWNLYWSLQAYKNEIIRQTVCFLVPEILSCFRNFIRA